MCRLTWSSSSLAVLTRGPRTQRLQPNHVIFVSKSSRRINYTQETAEPLGVSPPEAVDLLLIKIRSIRVELQQFGGEGVQEPSGLDSSQASDKLPIDILLEELSRHPN